MISYCSLHWLYLTSVIIVTIIILLTLFTTLFTIDTQQLFECEITKMLTTVGFSINKGKPELGRPLSIENRLRIKSGTWLVFRSSKKTVFLAHF